jgi:hypothetical protein
MQDYVGKQSITFVLQEIHLPSDSALPHSVAK